MKAEEVLDLYNRLQKLGIEVWIDGGWAVDALLASQTRPHKDLDIAIQWKDVQRLRELLEADGYKQLREDSQWNFVLADDSGHELDVHAFIFDDQKNVVEGIMYPAASLTGTGLINGQAVRCISAEYMVQFLAPWIHKWPEKYLQAIELLCATFNLPLPDNYPNTKTP